VQPEPTTVAGERSFSNGGITVSPGATAGSSTKSGTHARRSASNTTIPGGTITVPITGGTTAGGTSGGGTSTQGGTSPTNPSTPTTLAPLLPYDPSRPGGIHLGDVPGVTPAEQARAEELVRDTIRDLAKYADVNAAYNDGYRSINDAVTGDEHYIKWAYINDGHILDSTRPESLVYEWRNNRKTLVAAMYMLPLGSRFTDVPDIGGPMTQWHIHNNLCLSDNPNDPLQKVVSGLTDQNGLCPTGTTKAPPVPMIHVWIVANACGPFASLEGIGAGQVPPGETRECITGFR